MGARAMPTLRVSQKGDSCPFEEQSDEKSLYYSRDFCVRNNKMKVCRAFSKPSELQPQNQPNSEVPNRFSDFTKNKSWKYKKPYLSIRSLANR